MEAHILCSSKWCSYEGTNLIRTITCINHILGYIDAGNQGHVQVWSGKKCTVAQQLPCRIKASCTLMTPNPCHKHGLGVGTSYHYGEGLGCCMVIKHPIVCRVQPRGSTAVAPECAGGGWLSHSGKGCRKWYWWKGDFMASQSVEENVQRAHKLFHFGGLGTFQGNLNILNEICH